MPNPFRVQSLFNILIPGLSLRSNPGLKLANAFGVIVLIPRLSLRSNPGLKLANAFGVIWSNLAEAFDVIWSKFKLIHYCQ